MPNIDERAKAWQVALAGRVGNAVQKRRKALGLTAQALAARTVELGYPLTRVAISKIESNQRSGKLDVAELFVLAAALDIPPAVLLFAEYPEGRVGVLPDRVGTSVDAVRWLAGDQPIPESEDRNGDTTFGDAGDGVLMVRAVNKSAELLDQIRQLDAWLAVASISGQRGEHTPDKDEIDANRDRRNWLMRRYSLVDHDSTMAWIRLWGADDSDA